MKPWKAKLKTAKPWIRVWIDRGIFALKTSDGRTKYGISYTFEHRRVREIVGTSLQTARQARQIRLAEIVQGRFDMPKRHAALSFAQYVEIYLKTREGKRTLRNDRRVLNQLKQRFGTRQLTNIKQWDLELWKHDRLGKVKPSSFNREFATLRHALNIAVQLGHIRVSPANGLKSARVDESVQRILSAGEEVKLLEAASSHLRPMIFLALHAGMRRSEIFRLRWDHINWKERVIIVGAERSKSRRIRTVPMNRTVLSVMKRLHKGRQIGYVFGEGLKPLIDIKTAFLGAVRRSRIPPIRFHDLRHTFGTRLVLKGEDLKTVQELLGHSDIRMTMRYLHPSPAHKRKAVEKLSDKKDVGDIANAWKKEGPK